MDKAASHVMQMVSSQFHYTFDISLALAAVVVAAAEVVEEVAVAAEVVEEAAVAQALEP